MAGHKSNGSVLKTEAAAEPDKVSVLAEQIFLQTYNSATQRTLSHRVNEAFEAAEAFYSEVDKRNQ